MVLIPGPICLNCEEKKNTPYPTTIDERSGNICNECYSTHIWAQKKDQKIQQVGKLKKCPSARFVIITKEKILKNKIFFTSNVFLAKLFQWILSPVKNK